MIYPVLRPLDAAGLERAQLEVTSSHYLHKPVDVRSMPEGYSVRIAGALHVGYLILGRPQATRCYPWYGSVDDVARGRAAVTRWQVLNLARVWLDPRVQAGGELAKPGLVPGFVDRHCDWRPTLASTTLRQLEGQVVLDYLVRRPPCFLEEPYQLRWLLSYCDTRLHRGTIYRAAGWELWRTNAAGIQTWRRPLRALSDAEDWQVRAAAAVHPRSIAHRARRAQLALEVA